MEAWIAAREETTVAVATFFNASVNWSGFDESLGIFNKATPPKDSLQLSGEKINLYVGSVYDGVPQGIPTVPPVIAVRPELPFRSVQQERVSILIMLFSFVWYPPGKCS